MAVVIDNVLAAKINVRVCEIERNACRTLLPVARLKMLAAMTAVFGSIAAPYAVRAAGYRRACLPHRAGFLLAARCGTSLPAPE
jgi:hypothetical protein